MGCAADAYTQHRGFEYEPRLAAPIGLGRLRWRLIALLLAGSAAFTAVIATLFAAAAVREGSVLAFVAVVAAIILLDELIPWPRRQRS